jgi:quercetin dioxygenase-like cupin family protein
MLSRVESVQMALPDDAEQRDFEEGEMGANTVVRKAGSGQSVWLLGGRYAVKVSAEDSGGEVTVMEVAMPTGVGPPPHTHQGGETAYILEGTARFNIGDQTIDAGPGDVIYIPAGTVENFESTSYLRAVLTYMPGGIDKYFLEVGEPAADVGLPPTPEGPPPPEFLERLTSVGARYGLHFKVPGATSP